MLHRHAVREALMFRQLNDDAEAQRKAQHDQQSLPGNFHSESRRARRKRTLELIKGAK